MPPAALRAVCAPGPTAKKGGSRLLAGGAPQTTVQSGLACTPRWASAVRQCATPPKSTTSAMRLWSKPRSWSLRVTAGKYWAAPAR
eukprot:698515-Pyramimonas_sp.AAC.1